MLEQLQRYSRPVPRYTSYPTAPVFSDGFDHADYARLLEQPQRVDRPLSLYFHFPFCRNICYFCACTVIYTANKKRSAPYLALMVREMDLVAERLAGGRDEKQRSLREVRQLHYGGGTPGFSSPDEIRGFHQEITKRFRIAEDAELSVELDPRETTDDHIAAFTECGFNRASLGIQDLDPVVQKAINRVQPFEDIRTLLAKLRDRGFRGINLDLIYGLPHQTPDGFARTVDAVLELLPDRVSLFQFAYLPELKQHQQRIDATKLPDVRTRLEILSRSIEQLTRAGYVYIGMDHFAHPDDAMAVAARTGNLQRNFQGYTVPPFDKNETEKEDTGSKVGNKTENAIGHESEAAECDLLAFGVSAIGDLRDAYIQNTRNLIDYKIAIEAEKLPVDRGLLLNRDDQERREIIMGLICQFELDFDDNFYTRYAAEFEALETFCAEGLVEIRLPSPDERGLLCVTDPGKFVIRNICQVFDAYTNELAARGQKFSQSV